MVAALARESSGISFDQEPGADVVWDELDLQAFSDAFHRVTGRTLDAAAYEKLGLASEVRNDTVPTNAAILLSDADRLRRWFPYAKIECSSFCFQHGMDDPIRFHGTIRTVCCSTAYPNRCRRFCFEQL
jgi:predicted HTH transcriptional regulator